MPQGHFGASIASISLLSTELWAFKVGAANFSISKNSLKVKIQKFSKFSKIFQKVPEKLLDIFSIIFLRSLNVYIPRDTGQKDCPPICYLVASGALCVWGSCN